MFQIAFDITELIKAVACYVQEQESVTISVIALC